MPDLREVLLVRHGETEWNRAGRRQGQLDSPLTPRGIDQARAAAELVSAAGPDSVFTSPLGRTRATAGIIGDATGLPVEILGELAEVDHGRFAGVDPTRPVLVTHEMFARMLLRRLTGVTAADALAWSLPQGAVLRIRPNEGLVERLG
jgi:broad specificity phosphatase PhoE